MPASARCISCSPGFYASAVRSKRCLECEPGKASGSASAVQCESCRPGTFSSGFGNVQCSPCAQGFFAPGNGSTSCLPCPKGSSASVSESIRCVECEPGFYTDVNGSARCIACGKGTHQAARGQAICDTCLEGQAAPVEGLAECEACKPGTVTNNITGFALCQPCPDGTYNVAGLQARNGSTVSQQQCQLCPENCRCSPLLGGSGIVSNADYFLSFDAQAVAVVSRCAPGYCASDSRCGANRRPGSPLCNECLPGLLDWQGACVECPGPNTGLIILFLVICFVLVIILHVLSSTANRSGHLKIFM